MIQIDMEMPKSCGSCVYNESSCRCSITKSPIDRDYEYRERLSDCPLKEVPTGKWIKQKSFPNWSKCSNCGNSWTYSSGEPPYCPNCGSRNVVEEQQGENT